MARPLCALAVLALLAACGPLDEETAEPGNRAPSSATAPGVRDPNVASAAVPNDQRPPQPEEPAAPEDSPLAEPPAAEEPPPAALPPANAHVEPGCTAGWYVINIGTAPSTCKDFWFDGDIIEVTAGQAGATMPATGGRTYAIKELSATQKYPGDGKAAALFVGLLSSSDGLSGTLTIDPHANDAQRITGSYDITFRDKRRKGSFVSDICPTGFPTCK